MTDEASEENSNSGRPFQMVRAREAIKEPWGRLKDLVHSTGMNMGDFLALNADQSGRDQPTNRIRSADEFFWMGDNVRRARYLMGCLGKLKTMDGYQLTGGERKFSKEFKSIVSEMLEMAKMSEKTVPSNWASIPRKSSLIDR